MSGASGPGDAIAQVSAVCARGAPVVQESMSLRARARAVLQADRPIADELLAMADRHVRPQPAVRIGVSMASVRTFVEGEPGWPTRARTPEERDGRTHAEAVVVAHGRPAMLVQRNRIQLPESSELRRRLEATRARYESRLASVGRIELTGHPRLHQVGTAWIIAEQLVVTNAHVAEEFVARDQTHLVFRRAVGQDTMAARVDLREEYVAEGATTEQFEVGVDQVLYLADLADAQAPDLALLRLSPGSGGLPPPIPFADVPLDWGRDIAVVGYPAEDPLGAPSAEVARRLFGGIYGVKRFSPGRISTTPAGAWAFSHDATTLGGSSGSVVIDLETGGAVGVHFAGTLERANFAVRGSYVLDALTAIRPMISVPATPPPAPDVPAEPPLVRPSPSSYTMRDGYRDDFLGEGLPPAPVPVIVRREDVLEIEWQGERVRAIPYRHFSVVMSRSRRLCFVSAVNIDGARSVPHLRRRDWRLDPRLPEARQLAGPVYGNAPRFSRGHIGRIRPGATRGPRRRRATPIPCT